MDRCVQNLSMGMHSAVDSVGGWVFHWKSAASPEMKYRNLPRLHDTEHIVATPVTEPHSVYNSKLVSTARACGILHQAVMREIAAKRFAVYTAGKSDNMDSK